MKKKNNLKVRALLCVICLLILVYIPSVEGREIHYPKEDGPYTIFICGRTMEYGSSGTVDFDAQKWPFWNLDSDQTINYEFERITYLIVNGSLQKIKFPATIYMTGFKGFAPTEWMISLSILLFFRQRVFGKCESIRVWDDL